MVFILHNHSLRDVVVRYLPGVNGGPDSNWTILVQLECGLETWIVVWGKYGQFSVFFKRIIPFLTQKTSRYFFDHLDMSVFSS